MNNEAVIKEIKKLKKELPVTIVAHFYQRDSVYNLADITGDSLELAQKASKDPNPYLIFCGVGFMGQSVKILDPQKRVFMPRLACCSMARMMEVEGFHQSVQKLKEAAINTEDFLPITYINSTAEVKAEVAKLGGLVCTSSNAKEIIKEALKQEKKILFVPDRCLGQNIANEMGLRSAVITEDILSIQQADIICFDGFCSVHQLFTPEDVDFYKEKFSDILVAVHPECDPKVVAKADFVGSTSQIIKWVKAQPIEQKIAVGTEFNLVNRLREKNTFVLSSTKPECPTMNETEPQHILDVLVSIKNKTYLNEMFVDEETSKWAKVALVRMLER